MTSGARAANAITRRIEWPLGPKTDLRHASGTEPQYLNDTTLPFSRPAPATQIGER